MTDDKRATIPCASCGKLNRVRTSRIADRPKCGECSRPLLLDRPINLTDANFDKIIGGTEVPVIVDFWAEWCGPCKAMAPVLDDFARARAGSVLVAKLDTDRNQQTSMRFGIRGIPTLIVFRDGKESTRQVGAVPRARLEQLV